ncbi:hypothetical protein BFV94_4376 [Alteromonas macleodii]|uniref:Uncharacterized protein n=1 Tax=Alteromonas macleodii TaxID=28108 RepID=A0AB36FRM8_ALTMA|nr:hypothetical protein BFV95_4733 [Alteromonas macleodii]OES25523.1 hypothetical protein BFV94_4376 [Alteromonas macleodii]OES25825.1 hypothetical protein BFV93_4288 [Alteromonas macleodii]OES38655.1 hypothetical protein BFV96_4766 [Alteromonas macleodii]
MLTPINTLMDTKATSLQMGSKDNILEESQELLTAVNSTA